MSIEQKEEPEKTITEDIEILPAGRGHIVTIIHKKILPKSRQYKRKNPQFLHCAIKSNPKYIVLKEYSQEDGRRRIVLFPEGRVLSFEEREDFAASLLITLINHSQGTLPLATQPQHTTSPIPNSTKYVFPNKLRKICNQKLRRYERWIKRQQ